MLYNIDPTHFLMFIILGCSLLARRNSKLADIWALDPYRVSSNNEYYRFLTAPFIHRSPLHLGLNLLALFIFGSHTFENFQRVFTSRGSFLYLTLFMLASIICQIPPYLGHRQEKGFQSSGASAGISAIIFATLFLNPTLLSFTAFGHEFSFGGFMIGLGYLVACHLMAKTSADRHSGASVGALIGMLFVIFLHKSSLTLFAEKLLYLFS